jgi:1-acyl-sn-glycerol-3-phosphate acyltransferase
MRLIRSLLLLVFLIVFTIPYAIFCFISFPFLKVHGRYWVVSRWCATVTWIARHLNGIRYQIEGWENLPDGPAVLLVKHQSAWETIALPALMPKPLCFVFKRELLFVPFFGWALGMLKMIHIDRRQGKNAFNSMISQGRARLADGSWMIMFPEGTRIASGKQGKYKSGGARFAIEAHAPVVPIAHNAGRLWPRNAFTKIPGIVTVSIGAPIDTTGLTPDVLNARVETWIEAEMRRIDPESYSAANTAESESEAA